MTRLVLAGVALLALTGCATLGSPPLLPACQGGLKPGREARLFFGLSIRGRSDVSVAEWRNFVTGEITPRFPDGFTVLEASGHWLGPHGAEVEEASKELVLLLPGRPDDQARLDAIRAAYKTRFHQDSVLEVESDACAGF